MDYVKSPSFPKEQLGSAKWGDCLTKKNRSGAWPVWIDLLRSIKPLQFLLVGDYHCRDATIKTRIILTDEKLCYSLCITMKYVLYDLLYDTNNKKT